MATRAQIVEEARSYLGTKWVHQGRTRNGIDCAGLVVCVGNNLGLIAYDRNDYQRYPDGSAFLHFFTEGGGLQKPVLSAKAGDIMVLREGAYPCHTSIVSEKRGQLYIIHSFIVRKQVVEEPLTGAWLAKRVACFQYPGVED
jgi:cell wall-associated NlpC family hydrolase